jgi:uncharacterized cupin superfamily protein
MDGETRRREGATVNKTTSGDYFKALADADGVLPDLNDEATDEGGADLSEAEQMAAAVGGPRMRQDGKPVGSDRWGRERPLTDQQEAFLQGIIEGKPMKQAYREAYPNATANDASIGSSAYRLSKDPRIERRIIEAWGQTQEVLIDDVVATKRWVMRQLVELSKGADQQKDRLKALELLGRAAGMWRESTASTDKPLTAAELKAQLAGHLRLVRDSGKRSGLQGGDLQGGEPKVAGG